MEVATDRINKNGNTNFVHCFSDTPAIANAPIRLAIGCYQNADNLELIQNYFGGTLKKQSDSWSVGILIGQTIWNDWQGTGTFPGTIRDCAYIRRNEMKSMPVVGQVWPDADAAKCVPGEASMNTILRHDTEEESVTYPYDTSLTTSYPYRLWSTENGVKTYRGDWIAQ